MATAAHPTLVNVNTGVLGYDAGVQTDVQVFNADGTWTKPTGAEVVHVAVVAAGGGGGSGRRGAAGSVRCGGGGGGASLNGDNSGAGGLGGAGVVVVTSYF